MQEVHQLDDAAIIHFGYNLYWTSLKRKRQHAVGNAIDKPLDIVIDNIRKTDSY